MKLNPEFRRNLVLELNPHRLIAMPGILLLIFMLAFSMGGEEAGLQRAGWTALGLFAAITLFWGTQLAIASVVDEFRDKTWDTQRLSALDPWTLTWGKLLGGPVFAWYGGAICLLVFMIGMLLGRQFAPMGFSTSAMVALGIGAALMMHALGLLAALLLPRVGQRNSSLSIALLLFALMAGWPLVAGVLRPEPALWWGVRWDSAWFSAVSCWMFAAWAVLGVYRSLCTELQVRTMPGAWIGLAAFLSVYLTGFTVGRVESVSLVSLFAAFAFVVTLSMTYLSAWVEKRDVIGVRRLVLRYQIDDWRRTLEEIPCWLATAPLALFFALYLMARGGTLNVPGMPETTLSMVALAVSLLALRDIALLYYFSFAPGKRNAGVTAVVYLVLLYWVVPALLRAVGLAPVAQLVLPDFSGNAVFAVLVSAAQAVLAGWLAIARWRRRVSAIAPAAAGI